MTTTYDVGSATEIIRHHENPRLKVEAAKTLLAALVSAFPHATGKGALRARSLNEVSAVVERVAPWSDSEPVGWVRVDWSDASNSLVAKAWRRTLNDHDVPTAFALNFLRFDAPSGRYVAVAGSIEGDAVVGLVTAILSASELRVE